MNIEVQSAKLVLTLVDQETGELITREATLGNFKEVKKSSTSTRTKKPKDTDPVAKLTVLDGKVQLNNAAIELTGFEPEDKIAIQYEKRGRIITPVLMQNDKEGNRLTKTYTISCRGGKRDELLRYGDVFELEPYNEGTFKLKGNIEQPEDDIIDVPEEIASEDELDEAFDVDNIDFSFDD